jgi:hypothetical protein
MWASAIGRARPAKIPVSWKLRGALDLQESPPRCIGVAAGAALSAQMTESLSDVRVTATT